LFGAGAEKIIKEDNGQKMDIAYPKTITVSGEVKRKVYTSLDVCRRENEKSACFYPEFSVGFYKEGGALSSAPSVKKLFSSSADIKFLAGYRYFDSSYAEKRVLFAVNSAGNIYMSDLSSAFSKLPVILSGRVTLLSYTDLNGNDLAVFVAQNGAYAYDGNAAKFTAIHGIPAALCAELHSERLFVLKEDGYTLAFSNALDITDWTEEEQGAGHVSLPSDKGNIIAMKSFGGYLYLFRERGITRLRAMGDVMNFQHIELDVHCGNIYKDSIVECGEYIAFASDGGAFLFDGASVKKVSDEAADLVDFSSVTSAAKFRNCALMCVKFKKALPAYGGKGGVSTSEAAAYSLYSSEGERATILIDGEESAAYILPYPAQYLANIGETAYVFDADKNIGKLYETAKHERGEYMGESLPCVWDSGLTDFSLDGEIKALRVVRVRGEGDYVITAYNGKREVRFSCSGTCSVKPNLPGKEFGIRISCGNAKIYSAEVKINEYRYS